jgi:hypothetical protein
MNQSLRCLLEGIVDYAGVFPPANLPLDQAIRSYARYCGGAESWMLGRFVFPAARLFELGPFHEEIFQPGQTFRVSAIGRGGQSAGEFLKGLQADLDEITVFLDRHGNHVAVDVVEARIPDEVVNQHQAEAVASFIAASSAVIDTRGLPPVTPFYECKPGTDWRESTSAVIAGIVADHNAHAAGAHKFSHPAGFKLRCGGIEASAFPSIEQVAFTISSCRDAKVPLKFTAGLHHPFRHHEVELQTTMHGFLNVFAAGVLAECCDLKEAAIRQVVACEDSKSFKLDRHGLALGDLRATPEQIKTARSQFVTSFGSCSFDEPIADLKSLEILGSK